MFTVRYGMNSYIKPIRFVFKVLIFHLNLNKYLTYNRGLWYYYFYFKLPL